MADKTLVIGLGNPIMADDGLGIAALQRLRDVRLPASVRLVDGGTWGMNLLPLIEEADEVLLIDAIDRGEPPGSLIVLEQEQVPRWLGIKLSPHQVGLAEVLALAELRGSLPPRLVVIGLQPARVEMDSGLSPEVDAQMDQLLAVVLQQLERWGQIPQAVGGRHRCMS